MRFEKPGTFLRLLSTPGILLHIFEELGPKDLLRSALVCKNWTELAIDTKWRISPVRLSRLLSRLGHLEDTKERGWHEVSDSRMVNSFGNFF